MLRKYLIWFYLFLLISSVQSNCQAPVMNSETVDLASCDIVKLTADYFGTTSPADLSSVQNIDLTQNRLDTISNASFIRVEQLENLDLSNNHIQFLEEGALEGLDLLKDLNLHQNRLTTINLDVFKPCIRLMKLNIGLNYANKFEAHQNTTLSVLTFDLAFNKLEDISAISHLPHLHSLWLNNNRHLSLQMSTFHNNPKLTFLDLTETGLTAHKKFAHFLTGTREIIKLCLDRNNLAGLKIEDLPNLSFLETLQVGSCNLDHLDYEFLKRKFSSLREIYKAGNRFGCWHSKSFENYLEKNQIRISREKPTLNDIDDDMSCVFNSFDIMMVLILVALVIGALIAIYFIARLVFLHYFNSPENLHGVVYVNEPQNTNATNELNTMADKEYNGCQYMEMLS